RSPRSVAGAVPSPGGSEATGMPPCLYDRKTRKIFRALLRAPGLGTAPATNYAATSERLNQPRILIGLKEAVQMPDARRVPHLAQRLRLDLADALARDAELAPHFFQRARIAVDQAKALFENGALALRQRVEHVADLLLQQRVGRHLRRVLRALVL